MKIKRSYYVGIAAAYILLGSSCTRKLYPDMANIGNTGWTQKSSNLSYKAYTPNMDLTKVNTGKQLISVLPEGFATISNMKAYTRNIIHFDLEVTRYPGQNSQPFSAEQNITILVNNGKNSLPAKVLKSKQETLNANGTVKCSVYARSPFNSRRTKGVDITVTSGKDKHKFALNNKRSETGSMLSFIEFPPYYSEIIEQIEEIVEEPVVSMKEEEKKHAEVVKEKSNAETVVLEIRKELKEELERYLEKLQRERLISDKVQTDVSSNVVPQVNSENQIEYNLKVRFDYEVNDKLVGKVNVKNASDDWAPGRYILNDSQAAMSMLTVLNNALSEQLKPYIKEGTAITIKILGTTDASPIKRAIPYNNEFGEITNQPYYHNSNLEQITVNKETGITTNQQLGYLRTLSVADFIKNKIPAIQKMNTKVEHYVEVSEAKGSKFRRASIEVVIHDAFAKDFPVLSAEKNKLAEFKSDVDINIPKTETINKKALAVVIGNSKYENFVSKSNNVTQIDEVLYAMNDAKTIRDYINKAMGIPEENIIFKLNAEKKDFTEIFGDGENGGKLAELIAKTGDVSSLYVFYSGHGYPSQTTQDTYLLGVRDNPNNLKTYGMSITKLYEILAKYTQVKEINVIMDACFSGVNIPSRTSSVSVIIPIKKLPTDAMAVISATSNQEPARWYDAAKHGMFTYSFLKAIQDKERSDLNKDGVLTVEEIYKYVSDTNNPNSVPSKVDADYGAEQAPQLMGKQVQNKVVKY